MEIASRVGREILGIDDLRKKIVYGIVETLQCVLRLVSFDAA
jgi:hypothetical protein